jgi:hypothetical protein
MNMSSQKQYQIKSAKRTPENSPAIEEPVSELRERQRRRRSPDPAQGNALGRAQRISSPTPQAFARPDAECDDTLTLASFANSYRVLSFYILLSTQGAALG